jgi:DNA invertase Pin-like site-specific DNA recombinase
MIPIVEYRRVSTDRQATDGMGLEAQQAANAAFAERKGFSIVQAFSDDFSGASFNRPEYDAMWAFLQAHPDVKGVLVERQSRLSRGDIYEVGGEVKRFQDAGLLLGFAHEDAVLGVGEFLAGRLDLSVRALLAAHENYEKSTLVSSRMAQHAQTGHWQNMAPQGYRMVACDSLELPEAYRCCGKGRKLLPDEPAAIISAVFARYAGGQRRVEIQTWLREEHGILTDGRWLHQRLTNPASAVAVRFSSAAMNASGSSSDRTSRSHGSGTTIRTRCRSLKRTSTVFA